MLNHNINNERMKRKYFTFMKEAKRHSEASIDCIAKAITRFEQYNKLLTIIEDTEFTSPLLKRKKEEK